LTYDNTCTLCFEHDGVCPTKAGPNYDVTKEGYRQFYDCTSGGKTGSETTTTVKYCQLKPNSKYYAVIIVPVLAFAAIIAGLVFVFREKLGLVKKAEYAPPAEKATEVTNA
jgi:hypothetical protein